MSEEEKPVQGKTIEKIELETLELKGIGKDRAIRWWGAFGGSDSEPRKYFKEENEDD